MQLQRLKEWRESQGLMQKELAAAAKVSEFTVMRAEGGASMRITTARKIADGLGISVADLLEKPPVPLKEVDEDAVRRKELAKLRELLETAGAPTDHLALPEEEFERLWEGKFAEQREKINQELLEERRLVKPLLARWASMTASKARERRQLHDLWQRVYLTRLLRAVEKNQEAAESEADAASLAGDEARAQEIMKKAEEFAGAGIT